jgi:hypothetical protein
MSAKNIVMAAAGNSAAIQYVGGYAAGFAGSTTGQSVSLTSLTGGIASAPAADDLVIVYYGVSTLSADIAIGVDTAGYTEVAELFQTDLSAANLSVSYKVMGSTPDTTVTVSSSNQITYHRAVAIQVWRGVDKILPLDVARTTATGANSILCNPPSITPSTAGSVIVAGGVGAAGSTNNIVFSSSDLSSFLTAGSAIGSAYNANIGLGYKTWTSGAFDPAAFTINTSDNTGWSWAAVTLALRPNQNQPGPLLISQASTQNTSSGTTLVINKPTGTREGDLMVAIMGYGANSQGTWTGATGWTEVADLNEGSGHRVAYKVAGASEGASYTFTCTNSDLLGGTILTYRNAAYDTIGSFSALATGGSAITVPAVTPTANYSEIVLSLMDQGASATWPDQTGFSQLAVNADANAPSWRIFGKNALSDANVSSGAVATDSSATLGETSGIQLSIKPAASYTKYAQYIASTSATGNAAASLAVNTPACVPGNLLLFVVTVGISTATSLTVSTPSGWTLLAGNSTDTTAYQPGMYVFYRVVDGSEAASYTATPSSTAAMCGSIVSLAGVDVSTLTAGTTGTGSATTSITATGVTATANGILLYLGCQANSNQGPVTFTPPSGMTEAVDVAQDGASIDSTLEIAYQEGLTAGATGNKTATASANAGTNRYRAILVTVGAL